MTRGGDKNYDGVTRIHTPKSREFGLGWEMFSRYRFDVNGGGVAVSLLLHDYYPFQGHPIFALHLWLEVRVFAYT